MTATLVEAAPDIGFAVTGWRAWRLVTVGGRYALGSVIKRSAWPAGSPLVAQCLHPLSRRGLLRRPHHGTAPDVACECGIYATTLDRLGGYVAETPLRPGLHVLGEVSLWGRVIECEHGFRASHAYPRRLYLPVDDSPDVRGGWARLVGGLASYGVPVELLPYRQRDAGEMLERAAAHA